MTDRSSNQTGIGFFVALLVVIPAATWVGMHIPQAVLVAAARTEQFLANCGVLLPSQNQIPGTDDSPPTVAFTAWDTPPWTGSSVTGASGKTSTEEGAYAKPGNTGAQLRVGEKNLAGQTSLQPLTWAGDLLREAADQAAAVTGGNASPKTLGIDGSGWPDSRSGAVSRTMPGGSIQPASYVVEQGSSTAASKFVPQANGLSHKIEPDSLSRVGWDADWGNGGCAGGQCPIPANPTAVTASPRNDNLSGAKQQIPPKVGVDNPPGRNQIQPSATPSNQSNPDGVVFSPTDPRVHQFEVRLRSLGCRHYYLEQLDQPSGMYHFVAEFDQLPRGDRGRIFEATNEDPYRAIEDVLAQIESHLKGSGAN